MARRTRTRPKAQKGTRVAFRLNPEREREQVIVDYLASLTRQYRASGAAKRALYQMITGCDWETGERLVTGYVPPSAEAAETPSPVTDLEAQRQELDNILSGFADWEDAYALPMAQAGR